MAKKKAAAKVKSKAGPQFRGGRKAESLGRQIDRLQDKFPLDKLSAGEWLHYARVMKTTAEVLEIRVLSTMDPARFAGLKEAVVARGRAKAEARGKDADEEEVDGNED